MKGHCYDNAQCNHETGVCRNCGPVFHPPNGRPCPVCGESISYHTAAIVIDWMRRQDRQAEYGKDER